MGQIVKVNPLCCLEAQPFRAQEQLREDLTTCLSLTLLLNPISGGGAQSYNKLCFISFSLAEHFLNQHLQIIIYHENTKMLIHLVSSKIKVYVLYFML